MIVSLLAVLAAAGVATGAAVLTFGERCDLSALRPIKIGQNSFVYAADGSLLGAIPAERNRQVVRLGQISPWLVNATVAIEDRRFYSHGGVDAEGIARALWRDVKAGRVVEGGSTITQQLVRNLYISNERTVERKVTEACLAVKLERERSKQWILANYLNSVFYGNFAYGAEAAGRTYFSTLRPLADAPAGGPPRRADAGPVGVRPARQPGPRARASQRGARRDARRGDDQRAPVPLRRPQPGAAVPGRLYAEIREPYFFGYVRDELVRAYGTETVRSGGLRVYTTIQPRWQRLAANAIRGTLTSPHDPAAALISIDPATGSIRAMTAIVPGRANNQFNLLSQARRQPGSTFKTFVLAAAVEEGMDPGSTYYVSAPFTYRPDPNGNCEDGSWWCVKTYDSSYVGWTSVERATLRSDNSVFAQLTLDVGARRVAAVARRLGVRTPLEVNGQFPPAMGLGSVAVSPLDMASAYATLAAGGIYTKPTAIRKVVFPNGKPDDRWATATGGRASSPTASRTPSPGSSRTTSAPAPAPAPRSPGPSREDGDDRRARGRLVRRLHAGPRDRRLDGLHARRGPDGERPRHLRLGRLVPGRDLAAVHGAGARQPPARDFPRADAPATFTTWERGPTSLSYDPYYTPPRRAEPEKTEKEPTGTRDARRERRRARGAGLERTAAIGAEAASARAVRRP